MKMTYQTGLAGEQAAEEWLKMQKGMHPLESRYRNKAGEIDLIMLDGETVVFVEVKTRLTASAQEGLLAVDRKKQERIARAAAYYLMKKGWQKRFIRFDAVAVSRDGVLHVPGAFQPGAMFYR